VYKDTFDYNPTQIPPEWHGWVNYINDFPPTSYKYDKPKYLVDAYKTRTGEVLGV
jgi:NADH dehydrogenase (ubiquinone) 1 alpha subcomplex subunit 12